MMRGLAFAITLLGAAGASHAAPAGLGFYPKQQLHVTTGRCSECAAPEQGLWYFENEIIAVPRTGTPSLIWIGSKDLIENATMLAGGSSILTRSDEFMRLSLVPKLASNRSYFDASSVAFFSNRRLRLRGTQDSSTGIRRFTARTIWPEDYRIDLKRPLDPLTAGKKELSLMVTANDGGVRGPFFQRLLWEREPGRRADWAGHQVMGFILSGGQGDDDESQGGHFGAVTGQMGARGEMADWIVNNFYNLDEESEKGIIAGMVPMDNYLADLNSGQSYYRPAYMLVAVLRRPDAAAQLQEILRKTYIRFYKHDIRYDHAKYNCTGISMDAVRSAGWAIPSQGATSYLKAAGAFAYLSIKERGFNTAKSIFDDFVQEQTRLYPRFAFEAAGADLLDVLQGRAERGGRDLTDYERMLRRDVEAVYFVRFPQIPSSRAFGTFPVGSMDEYIARAPADHSKWKIVRVDPRPFPPPHGR